MSEFNKWLSKADIEFEYAFTAIMERDLNAVLEKAFKAGRDSMREELMAKLDYKTMRRDLIPESVGTMSHYGYAFLDGAEHCLTWVKKLFGDPNE
jgi:hypothetical protein